MSLHEAIHPINRLKICAALNKAGATASGISREMRFSTLAELTGLSASALSKQLGVLEGAGIVARHRDWASKRKNDAVWVTLTATGQAAFEEHMETLRRMVEENG